MRSFTINPKRFISLCLANGILSVDDLKEVVGSVKRGEDKGNTQVLGYSKDEHGRFFNIHVHTDKETKKVTTLGDGERVKFNFRVSQPKDQSAQKAQTPGDALGANAAQALAGLTPEQQAQVLSVYQALASGAPAPAAQPKAEDDWGDIDIDSL
jgi:hypothetical protein